MAETGSTVGYAGNRAMATSAPLTLKEIRALSDGGDISQARRSLRNLVADAPTPSNLAGAARMWESFESAPLPGEKTVRIALIGSGTLDPLGAQLRVAAAGIGLLPSVYVGQFDQWAQEMLAPDSLLYNFAPEIVFLAISSAALFPKTMTEAFVPDGECRSELDQGIANLLSALHALARTAPRATIVLSAFSVPDYSPFGAADPQMGANGQRARIEEINRRIAERLRSELPDVLLFDSDRAEARFGD